MRGPGPGAKPPLWVQGGKPPEADATSHAKIMIYRNHNRACITLLTMTEKLIVMWHEGVQGQRQLWVSGSKLPEALKLRHLFSAKIVMTEAFTDHVLPC